MTTTTDTPDKITVLGIECEVEEDFGGSTIYSNGESGEVHIWILHIVSKHREGERRRWQGEVSIRTKFQTWHVNLCGEDERKVKRFKTLEELESHLRDVIAEYRRILDGLATC